MKQELFDEIDRTASRLLDMADDIFDHPELGREEYRASKQLCDFLKERGFETELGIAGMDTAFRAVFERGGGGPSIGLLCEYDALEGMGHACAHHMQGPAILAAAATLKSILRERSFKLVVYGTPAEESTSGKIQLLEHGYFKDIDVALMMHGSPTTTTDIKSLALSAFTVVFRGASAHAALKPEAGRSALDALLLAFHGIECLREHVPDDTRIHYTVTDAGGPANVVPAQAKGQFILRSGNRAILDNAVMRFKKIIEGAALMTETSFDIKQEKTLNNKIPVLRLNEVLMDNAFLVGAPTIRPSREKTGSTDFGNVMYELPGSCIRVAFVPEGTSSHSEEFLKEGKTEAGHAAIVYAAKILAASSYDLITDEKLLREIRLEFQKNKERASQVP